MKAALILCSILLLQGCAFKLVRKAEYEFTQSAMELVKRADSEKWSCHLACRELKKMIAERIRK